MTESVPADTRRVCLLTGAAGRLGTAFCRRYAHQYRIAAVYHRKPPVVASQILSFVDPLDQGAALPENAHPVFALQADLATPEGLRSAVDQTLERFGRIDVLVNGAVRSVWAPMLGSSRLTDSADQQFHINVKVPLQLSLLVADRFWAARSDENRAENRNIINISSIAGAQVYPDSGQSLYAASKAALNQLTRHMALEFAPLGVRVNAAAPNSFPRLIATEWVADSLVQLDRGAMTGQILTLDAHRLKA